MSKSSKSEITPAMLLDGRRATRAYADLMFAFGFARLGDANTAEQLRSDAVRELDAIETNREFHRLARQAFECRIAEALRGEPHAGTLDDRCPEVIAALLIDDTTTSANSPAGLLAYYLGRVVERSAILEPLRRFEPYRRPILMTGGKSCPAWPPREPPSAEWHRLIEMADSPRAIWDAVRTSHVANDPRKADVYSKQGRYGYYQRLPELLSAARALPLEVVRRFLSAVLNSPPRLGNSFSTAPCFSRMHFSVVDTLVLAVVGTGPLPPEPERPELLEPLHSVRPPVLKWIQAMA